MEENTRYVTACEFLTCAFVLAAPSVAQAQTTKCFDHAAYLSMTSPAVLVDFDGSASGDGVITGNEFASQGLTITQLSARPMNLVTSADIAAGSGTSGVDSVNSYPNAISTSFFVSGYNNALDDNNAFEFTNGATTAGLWIGNVGPGSTLVEFLAPDDTVIASEVIEVNHVGIIGDIPAYDTRIFCGITTDRVIARIRTSEAPDDADGIVDDDVQFTPVSPQFRPSRELRCCFLPWCFAGLIWLALRKSDVTSVS